MVRIYFRLTYREILLAKEARVLVDLYRWGVRGVGVIRHLVVRVQILEIHKVSVLDFLEDGLFEGRWHEGVLKTSPWVVGGSHTGKRISSTCVPTDLTVGTTVE